MHVTFHKLNQKTHSGSSMYDAVTLKCLSLSTLIKRTKYGANYVICFIGKQNPCTSNLLIIEICARNVITNQRGSSDKNVKKNAYAYYFFPPLAPFAETGMYLLVRTLNWLLVPLKVLTTCSIGLLFIPDQQSVSFCQ